MRGAGGPELSTATRDSVSDGGDQYLDGRTGPFRLVPFIVSYSAVRLPAARAKHPTRPIPQVVKTCPGS